MGAVLGGIDTMHMQPGVETDVVVGELATVGIVYTDDLAFLGGAEAESGDNVENPAEHGGHDQ